MKDGGGEKECTWRHQTLWWAGVLGLLCFVTGCILLPIGGPMLGSGAGADPAADFEELGRACTLTEVKHVPREGQEGGGKNQAPKTVCYDAYFYTFTYEGRAYDERNHERKRCDRPCGDCGAALDPDFVEGEVVECWRATAPVNQRAYKCGNPGCYKIYEPAAELAGTMQVAISLLVSGAVLLVFGVGCVGLAYHMYVQLRTAGYTKPCSC